ncbi:dihydrolipoyl dehydrogenase [Neisseriaceae bacterium TC5R-5]|nr:dihydrolipoyl dehydrogenase [Neisseriaceae bacterium TC5R-5]
MQTLHIDVAVIGAGTAGLAAYGAAKAQGASVVMIEGGPYGTTCARVGCMPSKLLIAAAEAAHSAEHGAQFGVHVNGEVYVDGREVMARVKRERNRFVGFVVDSVDNLPAQEKLRGYARFIDATTLQVDEHTVVHAKRVVIATGSTPAVPAPFKALGDSVVVNDDVFAWDDLPASVAVFGPGVIGLELGQALSRLGVKVKVFGASGSVGPFSDPVVRDYALSTLGSEFYLDPKARVLAMEQVDGKAQIRFVNLDGEEVSESFDYALIATGRQPNVRHLGLENTGLQLDARGVPLFDPQTLQCGDSPVFIAGDANELLPLLHEAADQGKTAGDNAGRYPQVHAGFRRSSIAVVFSEPQMMMVGSRFADLPADSFVIGAINFEAQGRSRVMAVNKGLLHLYADKQTGRFLGAEMIGPRAENLAHLLAWSHQQQLTIAQMLDMPFYHPVIEEGLRTALRDAAAKLV